jgi:hypothetical protein
VASVALAAGLALSVLPAAQPQAPATDPATYSLSDPALRLQRAGEIGGGSSTGSLNGLTEHRKGEINEGGAGSSLPGLTEQRRGEINGGR